MSKRQSPSEQRYWNNKKTGLAIATDIVKRNQKREDYKKRTK